MIIWGITLKESDGGRKLIRRKKSGEIHRELEFGTNNDVVAQTKCKYNGGCALMNNAVSYDMKDISIVRYANHPAETLKEKASQGKPINGVRLNIPVFFYIQTNNYIPDSWGTSYLMPDGNVFVIDKVNLAYIIPAGNIKSFNYIVKPAHVVKVLANRGIESDTITALYNTMSNKISEDKLVSEMMHVFNVTQNDIAGLEQSA